MSILRPSLVFITVLVLASWFSVGARFAAAGEDTVALAISNGEDIINSAFQTVLEAEQAGANVSRLLISLNSAEQLLVQARFSFRIGDFENASRLAERSKEIGVVVESEAAGLRDLAEKSWHERFFVAIAGSMSSIGIIASGSFIGWRFFKRRYYRRVLGMKPEGSPDEP
ncbi:MAG TPA: hypothetical protein VJ249_11325 [Candidatus Bathyarchaeia archaeon]|nr:hypothetical protein [Candidatus Bathyarchaeia archaeon]